MDFSKLPTDNLYKFIAMSGVALAVTSVVWPILISKEVAERLDVLEVQFDADMASVVDYLMIPEELTPAINKGLQEKKLSSDYFGKEVLPGIVTSSDSERAKWLAHLYELSKEAKDERRKVLNVKEHTPTTLDQYGLTEAEFSKLTKEEQKKWADDLVKGLDDQVNTLVKLNGEAVTIWRLMDYKKFYFWLGVAGFGLGFLIAGGGFLGWWWKLQWYQDAMLVAEHEEARRNAASATSASPQPAPSTATPTPPPPPKTNG